MNRKNQITKDFAALLNDERLQLADVSQNASVTSFAVMLQKLARVLNSDGTPAGHYKIDFEHIVTIVLENDYSNILDAAADVLSRHPYRDAAPLMRLRRSSLSGKVRYTLGVTNSSNLEFFVCKNYKCSDDLGAALWYQIGRPPVQLVDHYTSAYMSDLARAGEYRVRLILNKDADNV